MIKRVLTTMPGICRNLTILGLASIVVSGSVVAFPDAALALSEQEILEKLNGIPVFLVVNDEGQSLTANLDVDESEVQVPIVFIDSIEAQAFIDRAESEEAEFAGVAQIAILPLSEVYAEASSQSNAANSLVYIPSAASMSQATQIVEQEIQGVPLYAAVNLEQDQYLLTGDNTLPMFFSLQDLQSQVSTLIEGNPEIEDAIGVEVTTFEGVLENMATDDPEVDRLMELIQFVPDSETLEYLQSLSGESAE
jgi:nickel transport protein